MPNLSALHPQVVHFVIGLLIVGVLLRVASLLRRWAWMTPAATALILLGTVASVAAVKSGDDAHGPAERVPGARDIVIEHEEWGERTRNIFLAIAALELVGLALSDPRRRTVHMLTAALGLGGLFALYETGEHGGELVYSYAGGVGLRTGEDADVGRLLLAGLYHQAMQDRRAGRSEDAAILFAEMGRRFNGDTTVRILAVESLLRDRKDAAAARAAIDDLSAGENARVVRQLGLLKTDIYEALGYRDSARAVMQDLVSKYPEVPRLKARLDSLR